MAGKEEAPPRVAEDEGLGPAFGEGLAGRRLGEVGLPPSAAARHPGRRGQSRQEGARGTQTRAPRSIIAWLKAPGSPEAAACGVSHAARARRGAGLRKSPRNRLRRAKTRATLPSTTGIGSRKQMLAIAAAV